MFEFSPLVYQIAGVSRLFWMDFARHFQEAQNLMELGEQKIFSFPSFMLEIFNRFYYEPHPEKLQPPPPEAMWAEKLHNAFSDLVEFDRLVEICQANQLAAGLATIEFCQQILAKLPQPKQSLKDPQPIRDEVKRLKQQQQEDIELQQADGESLTPEQKARLAELTERDESVESQGSERKNQLQQQIENLILQGKNAVQAALAFAEEPGMSEGKIRAIVRGAAVATDKRLEEAKQQLTAFGAGWGNEPSGNNFMPIEEKLALASRISKNSQLQEIIKIAGRMKEVAERKRRTKFQNAFGELAGIELGNDLARIIPSELQKLADDDLFPLFAKGYYERSLLQYRIEGKDKASKGDIVMCIDTSSSMAGERDVWAKAVALVIAQIAREDKRNLRIIYFGSSVRRCDDFPPNHSHPLHLMESIAGFYCGGGTNWQAPLSMAVEGIRKEKVLKRADIILITDGQCQVSHQFREWFLSQRREVEFNCLGILIQQQASASLSPLCDRLWKVSDLNEVAIIEELFLI